MTIFSRSYQRFDKNFKKVDKRDEKGGILTNGDYNRNGKFGNNTFKVCQKLNEMTNEACWLLAIFTKMTNLAKIANLSRSNEWLAKWDGEKWPVGNQRFLRGWQILAKMANLGIIHEWFEQNSNEMTKKATLTITDFSKKANFCQKWWIWQRLIKCLAKTHRYVNKKKACENLSTSWDWTSCGPSSNGAEMTEEYLTIDVTLLSRKNKAFLLSLTKIYPLTGILPSMHWDGIN